MPRSLRGSLPFVACTCTRPHPRPKPNVLGPSNLSPLAVTISRPLAKSCSTSWALNAHGSLALEGSLSFLRLSLGFFHPPGLPQNAWNIPGLGIQVACGPSIWHHVTATQGRQPFPTTTSLSTSHHRSAVMCRRRPRGFANGSTRGNRHRLLAPFSLLVTRTEGVGSFGAVVLIYETCLRI